MLARAIWEAKTQRQLDEAETMSGATGLVSGKRGTGLSAVEKLFEQMRKVQHNVPAQVDAARSAFSILLKEICAKPQSELTEQEKLLLSIANEW